MQFRSRIGRADSQTSGDFYIAFEIPGIANDAVTIYRMTAAAKVPVVAGRAMGANDSEEIPARALYAIALDTVTIYAMAVASDIAVITMVIVTVYSGAITAQVAVISIIIDTVYGIGTAAE